MRSSESSPLMLIVIQGRIPIEQLGLEGQAVENGRVLSLDIKVMIHDSAAETEVGSEFRSLYI